MLVKKQQQCLSLKFYFDIIIKVICCVENDKKLLDLINDSTNYNCKYVLGSCYVRELPGSGYAIVFPIKQRFVWRESIFLDDPLTLVALVMRLGTVPSGCLRNNVSAECEMSESGFRVKKTRIQIFASAKFHRGINIDHDFITILGTLRNFVIEGGDSCSPCSRDRNRSSLLEFLRIFFVS